MNCDSLYFTDLQGLKIKNILESHYGFVCSDQNLSKNLSNSYCDLLNPPKDYRERFGGDIILIGCYFNIINDEIITIFTPAELVDYILIFLNIWQKAKHLDQDFIWPHNLAKFKWKINQVNNGYAFVMALFNFFPEINNYLRPIIYPDGYYYNFFIEDMLYDLENYLQRPDKYLLLLKFIKICSWYKNYKFINPIFIKNFSKHNKLLFPRTDIIDKIPIIFVKLYNWGQKNPDWYEDWEDLEAELGWIRPYTFEHRALGFKSFFFNELSSVYPDAFTHYHDKFAPDEYYETLEKYNDHVGYTHTPLQLFTKTRCFKHFTDLNNLKQILRNQYSNSSFFLPYPLPVSKYSQNSETLFTSTFDEAETLFICYGTITDYYTFEIGEFLPAVVKTSLGNKFTFPHNQKSFTLQDVFSFQEIIIFLRDFGCQSIPFYPKKNVTQAEIDNLDNLLKSHINNRNNNDDIIIQQFETLLQKDKDQVEKMLEEIFHTGMRMRRWNGNKNSYPLTEEQTLIAINEVKLFNNVNKQAILVNKHLENPKCRNIFDIMWGYTYVNNKSLPTVKNFKHYWDAVFQDNFCIRLQSTIIISTANHYHELLTHKSFPGFDKKLVQPIS